MYIVLEYLADYFSSRKSVFIIITRAHKGGRITLPKVRRNLGKNTFIYSEATIFNELPKEQRKLSEILELVKL